MSLYLPVIVVIAILWVANGFLRSARPVSTVTSRLSRRSPLILPVLHSTSTTTTGDLGSTTGNIPSRPALSTSFSPLRGGKVTRARALLTSLSLVVPSLLLRRPEAANAIGSLFELQQQSCVLQDVSFNVQDASREAEMFRLLFQDTSRVLRTTRQGGTNATTIGFGPDVYKQPAEFYPGASSLFEYGGHSTITLLGPSGVAAAEDGTEEVSEILNPGTGLQFIKIGTEQLRISKGIQAGATVKYAYGWVDLDSPSGIPLEIVVGTVADPLMYACLRVTSLQESIRFFESMGMVRRPPPYARTKGSNFEPQLPADAVYFTYVGSNPAASNSSSVEDNVPVNGSFSPDPPGMGLLLVQRDARKKQPPVTVGSVLEGFKIIVDTTQPLPESVAAAIKDGGGGEGVLTSPDGYRFILQPFEKFEKESKVQQK